LPGVRERDCTGGGVSGSHDCEVQLRRQVRFQVQLGHEGAAHGGGAQLRSWGRDGVQLRHENALVVMVSSAFTASPFFVLVTKLYFVMPCLRSCTSRLSVGRTGLRDCPAFESAIARAGACPAAAIAKCNFEDKCVPKCNLGTRGAAHGGGAQLRRWGRDGVQLCHEKALVVMVSSAFMGSPLLR